MIVCPNCNHPNPEGAQACEACYTPLPSTTTCPNCGTLVQTDAKFCGECGYNLHASTETLHAQNLGSDIPPTAPDLVSPDPLVSPDLFEKTEALAPNLSVLNPMPVPATEATNNSANSSEANTSSQKQPPGPVTPTGQPAANSKTQLQQQKAKLLHVQTNTLLELPPSLSVIHIGKPNERIPPDIDVAGFPNSEIVSRIHADIRIEGDAFYLEDVGSSNGTYVNNMPLPPGNRHRLRVGDRIALGKGDLVTFLFQLS